MAVEIIPPVIVSSSVSDVSLDPVPAPDVLVVLDHVSVIMVLYDRYDPPLIEREYVVVPSVIVEFASNGLDVAVTVLLDIISSTSEREMLPLTLEIVIVYVA